MEPWNIHDRGATASDLLLCNFSSLFSNSYGEYYRDSGRHALITMMINQTTQAHRQCLCFASSARREAYPGYFLSAFTLWSVQQNSAMKGAGVNSLANY